MQQQDKFTGIYVLRAGMKMVSCHNRNGFIRYKKIWRLKVPAPAGHRFVRKRKNGPVANVEAA